METKRKIYAIAIVLFTAVAGLILANHFGIIPMGSLFNNPSTSSPSDLDSHNSTTPTGTTTTVPSSTQTLTITGVEMLRETGASPNSYSVELEIGRYRVSFTSSDDIKVTLNRGNNFKSTNGVYSKDGSFNFDVNIGEDGMYNLILEGDASEMSIAVTQLLKFEKEV